VADRRRRVRLLELEALPLAQLDQGVEDRRLQLRRRAEGGGDETGLVHQPVAEAPLALAVDDVGEVLDRDERVLGEQEDQPRDTPRGGGLELDLGVGQRRPLARRRAVAEADQADVDVARANLGDAEVRRRVVARAEVRHVDGEVAGPGHGALRRRDERQLARIGP
jgi:hypothetical protein